MESNLDKLFKTDDGLEKNGVWFDLSSETGFLLRPYKGSNPRVKAAMARYYKPYARQVELGTLDRAIEDEIQIKMFIDICLVDWKGVSSAGKDIPCNPENALKIFTKLPDLFDTLWRHATDFKNYKEELGNS